jgi:hypothetical protein
VVNRTRACGFLQSGALARRFGRLGLEIVVEQKAATTVWFEISRPQHDEPLAIRPTAPE